MCGLLFACSLTAIVYSAVASEDDPCQGQVNHPLLQRVVARHDIERAIRINAIEVTRLRAEVALLSDPAARATAIALSSAELADEMKFLAEAQRQEYLAVCRSIPR